MSYSLRVPKSAVFVLLVAIDLLVLICIAHNAIFSLIIAYLFWTIGIAFSLRNIRRRLTLFSFDIGFFVFILGGFSISYFRKGDFSFFSNSYFTSSEAANIHTCICVAFCMICVNCGYIALCGRDGNDKGKNREVESTIVATGNVKLIITVILILSYICRMLQAIEAFYLVKAVTYYESVSYLSTLPSIVIHIGSLYFVTLFMYLATYPSKRITVICLVSLSVLELITLAAGSRGEPISIVFLIIFYIFLRNRAGYHDIAITKKIIIVGLLMLPALMYSLQAISYTRNGAVYNQSFSEGVMDFIETQGVSSKIIANSYDLDEKIYQMTNKRTFILGEIRYYFKSNVFTRLLTGKTITLRTVEDAFSGDNYLRSYGYAYAPATYIRNVGAGSTYIAEAYYDGRYPILVIANLFIAFLLFKIDRISVSNFVTCSILMNVFRYMPTLPRGMMLDWFVNTFAIQNILYFIVIYQMCRRKL